MNSNTIEVVKKELCSGCSACYNACPKDAIKMEYDEEGFLFPVVDEERCVSCGLCKNVCPALNPYKENDKEPKVYVVKREEQYAKASTSAGVFAALAEYVLENNGYVCGAVYDENFKVCHMVTDNTEGVNRIKQSKYVQSEIGLVYREIKVLLEEGQFVLFSGTPCQVAGLRKYLRKRYDNLITMDILCHGVPAPRSWERYLEENIDRSKLKKVEFRHKGNYGFKTARICFTYDDGRKVVQRAGENPYYYQFQRHLGLRNSCTHCEGAVVPRVGDFSAGDFWGASKYCPELIESDKGISILFVNNEHAQYHFEKIKDKFSLMNETTVLKGMSGNRSKVTRYMHLNRDRFLKMLQYMSFNDAVKKNIGRPFDVAIYGNTMSTNYGVLVGYYALYKYLYDEGYGVVMIPAPQFGVSKKKSHAQRFMEENVVQAPVRRMDDFSEYNAWGDVFLLGPDQVWNQKLFKVRQFNFCLDFVNEEKKKIAYGSSFGKLFSFEDENDSDYAKIQSLLSEFEQVAVLDDVTMNIATSKYAMSPKQVIDPIFLLGEDEYNAVADKAIMTTEGSNIAVYVLNGKKDFRKGVSFVEDTLQLPSIYMGNGNYEKLKKQQVSGIKYCENLQVEEWINNIRNSKFVITDTSYAVYLAIIFRKNFVVIQSQNAMGTLEELLSRLNLKNRYFTTAEELIATAEVLTQDIDYDAVNKILGAEIDKSKEWLMNAIGREKIISAKKESESEEENNENLWKRIRNAIKW